MIVEVDEKNIAHVVEILNEAYRSGRGWATEKDLVSGLRATKELLKREIKDGFRYFIYQRNQDYVGCFSLSESDNSIEIGGLCIRPSLQNSGLGSFLLKKAESVAFETPGVKRITLSVLEPRKELIAYYKRRGYLLTDIQYPFPVSRGVGLPQEENVRVVVLEKNA